MLYHIYRNESAVWPKSREN